jgi:hypothetical protein
MALTLRHWALAGALACAVIAVAKLPPPAERPLPPGAPRLDAFEVPLDRVQLLRVALRRNRSALDRAAVVADLISRARAAPPRPDGDPVLVTSLPLAPPTRRAIEDQIGALWHELGPMSPDVAVRFVLVNDVVPMQILPRATDGRSCVVRLPIAWSLRWILRSAEPPSVEQLDPWLRQAVGPCAFYAAFGRPGPAVEEWLLRRGFDIATDVNWAQSAALTTRQAGENASPDAERLARAIMFWELDQRYQSLDAVACYAGDLTRCHAALFPTAVPRDRQEPVGVVVRWWWDRRGALYRGQEYLADLVREMGRERFQAFWRSPASVEAAFQSAMGQPIEVWTARWERQRMEGLVVRSRIRPLSVLLGLLVAGLCVAGSAYRAGRRQIG